MTHRAYFSQILRVSKLASVFSTFLHCQLELTEQNSIVAFDIPPYTAPWLILIIVRIRHGHLTDVCVALFSFCHFEIKWTHITQKMSHS